MHFQNLPINRCNPSPETTISQSNHLPLLLFTPSKDIFIHCTFSIVALFSYSNVSIAVYTRTTALCNLASKIQGSRVPLRCLRANSTHLHFAFSAKIERAAKSATLPYAFYIFEVLIFSFVVWFSVTPFRIFIPQWNQSTFASSEV